MVGLLSAMLKFNREYYINPTPLIYFHKICLYNSLVLEPSRKKNAINYQQSSIHRNNLKSQISSGQSNKYSITSSQQLQLSYHQTYMKPSQQTICGPFDQEFKRKFRGTFTRSMSAQRIKLAKIPHQVSPQPRGTSLINHEMLPKLKEIQKIAKTERKKTHKVNKYVDGVTDLELYLANKIMNNTSARQIVSQISRKQPSQYENRKILTENYLRMTVPGSTHEKLNLINYQLSEHQNGFQELRKAEGTSSRKKLYHHVSDQEFMDKFDQFIVRKRAQDEGGNKDWGSTKDIVPKEEAEKQISTAKELLTKIARKMIAEHNNYSDDDEVGEDNVYVYHQDDSKKTQQRSIDWILKECLAYEKKFKVRKNNAQKKRA